MEEPVRQRHRSPVAQLERRGPVMLSVMVGTLARVTVPEAWMALWWPSVAKLQPVAGRGPTRRRTL